MSTTCVQTLTVSRTPRASGYEPHAGGRVLLRSSSFNKLREFPVYLCRQGSTDILQWINNSRTNITCFLIQQQKQLREILLKITVWATLLLLCTQLLTCIFALLSTPCPLGLAFMISCIGAMAGLAAMIWSAANTEVPSPTSSPQRRLSRSRAKQQ